LPYKESGLMDTSEEVEVQVKVIVLRHIRKCYRPACACPAARPLLVAPAPPKLIPKGKFTLQTWVKFLLDKYLAQLPVNRQRLLLAQAGLPISKGTIHGGFDRLQDYLVPLYEHFLAHLRQTEHIHADETRWMIFEDVAGKANHRWWLWLFASTNVICLVLDPHRSAAVPFKALSEPLPKNLAPPSDPACVMREIEGQIYIFTPNLKSISADRYPLYPSLSPYVHVAFCWAHQRRDFTDFQVAHTHESDQMAWAAAWIATIALLYLLNEDRLADLDNPQADATTAQAALQQAIAAIAQKVAVRTELSTPQRKLAARTISATKLLG
jgi:transposase